MYQPALKSTRGQSAIYGAATCSNRTGVTIACAMELSQKGYIEDTIRLGDAEIILEPTKMMAYRKGIGNKMTGGWYPFAEK